MNLPSVIPAAIINKVLVPGLKELAPLKNFSESICSWILLQWQWKESCNSISSASI
jgi:hypothetical protein